MYFIPLHLCNGPTKSIPLHTQLFKITIKLPIEIVTFILYIFKMNDLLVYYITKRFTSELLFWERKKDR